MADSGKPARRRPSPQWLTTLAAGLVDTVQSRGMTLTVTAAEAIVADRIAAVATMGISERRARAYIDVDVLADALVDSFAAEEPGAELLKLPHDAGLRVSGIGRLVAALAQCSHFFARYAEVDEALSRMRGTEIAELISTLGLIQASHEMGDVVFAPRALFVRISRMLENVAELTADADLSRVLREDALLAKAGAKTHRI
jgi:hypothetical protein